MTEIGDESTARFQGSAHASDHLLRLLDPVEHGFAVDGVVRLSAGEIPRVCDLESQPRIIAPSLLDHLGVHVNPDDLGASRTDPGGVEARAATQVEDSFAWLGRKQVEQRSIDLRNVRVLGVITWPQERGWCWLFLAFHPSFLEGCCLWSNGPAVVMGKEIRK